MKFHLIKSEWDGITVEYGQMLETGEFDAQMPRQGIAVAFAPHDLVVRSVDRGLHQTKTLPPSSEFNIDRDGWG